MNRSIKRAARAIGCAALLSGCAEREAPTRGVDEPLAARAPSDGWVLAFGDDFDGDALDTTKWLVWEGDRHHKGTINTSSRSMVTVREGSLVVSAVPTPENQAFPYTAGYLNTDGLFAQTYGKIEFRVRCAFAPGLWYAVWGRPWTNAVPEVDIEFLAENINQAWLVNHWALPPLPADERRRFTTIDGMDITKFHTYAVTWTPELLEWEIDGKPYMRVTDQGVPHEPMFWTINAWVGGWAGTPNPATIFPASFEVDYFRVYRPREWLTPPQVRVGNPRERYSVGDAIHIELADFDAGAHVEIWDGDVLVDTMANPPFRFKPRKLTRAAHTLAFVATDGTRTASTSIDVTIY